MFFKLLFTIILCFNIISAIGFTYSNKTKFIDQPCAVVEIGTNTPEGWDFPTLNLFIGKFSVKNQQVEKTASRVW